LWWDDIDLRENIGGLQDGQGSTPRSVAGA
jgi:hypothetical protein